MSIFIYNITLQNNDFGVLQKSSKHFLISIFFPCPTPRSVLRASNNEDLFFYNFVVKNVFCQYLFTIQPYKIRILVCFRSHLSIS